MAFDINLDTSKALGKIKVLNTSLDGISRKIKKINTEGVTFARVGASAAALKGQANAGALGLQNLTRSVVQVKGAVTTANAGITHLNKQFGTFSNRSAAGRKSLNEFRTSMDHTAKGAAALRAGMYATGTHFGAFTARTIIAATATFLVVKAFASMIQVGAEFEQAMARANAVMGNFDSQGRLIAKNANMLEKEVRRLGETTVFTVAEVAQGLVFLGMAGLNTSEAHAALAPVLNIASIGMIDMAKAADIATNIMLGFDKQASDLVEIVDIMAIAVTNSNMDIIQLGTSLSFVAPIASATNNTIKETVAILELFHNVGIKSSRAGTSLRRALINLSKPTEKVQSVLSKLGVTMFDQENKMKPLIKIMREFSAANASTADILTIFGARAGPALIKLYSDIQKEAGGATSSIQKFLGQMKETDGAAESLRERIEDVLAADWKKMVSALSELAIQIFEQIGPALRGIVQTASEFIKALDGRVVSIFTTSIIALAVAYYGLSPLIVRIIALKTGAITATVALTAATSRLAAVVGFLSGPYGWALMAVGLAAYAFSQRNSNKETITAITAAQKEADGLERVAKIKRDLNDLTMSALDMRRKGVKLTILEQKGSLAEATLKEKDAWFEMNDALEAVAKKRAEMRKMGNVGALGPELELRTLEKQLSEVRKRSEATVEQKALIRDNITLLQEELGIIKDQGAERNKAIAEIQRAKEVAIDAALSSAPTDYKAVMASEKLLTQERLRQVNLLKDTKQIDSVTASKARVDILKTEASVVQADLDVRITKQQRIVDLARENLVALRADTGEGSKSSIAAIKDFDDKREKLEKLQKAEANYQRGIQSRVQTERDAITKAGAAVSNSLDGPLQRETREYEERLALLKQYLKDKGATIDESNAQIGQLETQHWLTQAQTVLSGAQGIINNLAQAASIRFEMSLQEAQDTYDLYQESLSRQEAFTEASQNATTAGDRVYYKNLADQYKAYSSQYKRQFEEADAIARSNFEKHKKYQIAQAYINTASAVMLGYSQLGPIGGSIAAAATIALGAQMVSQIKAQQYEGPAGGLTSGAFGGLPESPGDTSSSIGDDPRTDGQTNALNIYIEGAITEEMITEVVIPVIQDGIDNRDIVLISGTGGDSAQLTEVQGA